MNSSTPKRTFSLRARRPTRALRICGVINLACAVPLTIAGVGLWIALPVVAAGTGGLIALAKWALICSLFGPLVAWCGLMMLFRVVALTATRLSSGSSLRVVRRCPRDAVVAIDIRQRNFGRAPRAVPFAVLGDGTNIPLMPLATLLSRTGRQLEIQRTVVGDLRRALGVEGTDLAGSEVLWPTARVK
ncbi:MAG: hypothetical protein JWM55_1144 [Acidimicrobiaceae bacterium]|nr:hypothetical protein [Acidimicrobiaceae bacterium]